MQVRFKRITSVAAVALVLVGAVAAAGDLAWRAETRDAQSFASQARTIAEMKAEMKLLEARTKSQPDWPAIAMAAEPSVFTISTDYGLGSGWVVDADATGSDLVTNFHVVEGAVSAGTFIVDVLQFDRAMKGTIVRVDRDDDLALIHIDIQFAPLAVAYLRPRLGSTVMVVGSPLGLRGSVSVGVVSGFRSLGGSDYLQFSAPISPGNSGGPVIDGEGQVVGIATAKLVGAGVEALGLAIPVQMTCLQLVRCAQA